MVYSFTSGHFRNVNHCVSRTLCWEFCFVQIIWFCSAPWERVTHFRCELSSIKSPNDAFVVLFSGLLFPPHFVSEFSPVPTHEWLCAGCSLTATNFRDDDNDRNDCYSYSYCYYTPNGRNYYDYYCCRAFGWPSSSRTEQCDSILQSTIE